jgi:hypothetical protein
MVCEGVVDDQCLGRHHERKEERDQEITNHLWGCLHWPAGVIGVRTWSSKRNRIISASRSMPTRLQAREGIAVVKGYMSAVVLSTSEALFACLDSHIPAATCE